jgi:putative membrane protein
MKNFDNNFRTKLYEEITKLEQQAQVEAVVVIKESSDTYLPWILSGAAATSFLVLTILMYIPTEIDPYIIYYATILSYIAAFFAFKFIKPLLRLIVPTNTMLKNTEICARASFQKGKIYNTSEHTGLFIYCSVFEKQSFLIADIGISNQIPENEIEKIKQRLNNVFNTNNPENNIIECIAYISPILANYMPHRDDDINELPDNLDITL